MFVRVVAHVDDGEPPTLTDVFSVLFTYKDPSFTGYKLILDVG